VSSVTEVRDQAIEVARGWSAPGAPASWRLTAALFEAVAADGTLLGAIASLPSDRLPALLAGAAVSLLARGDTASRLHAYFPERGASQPSFDEGFFSAFTSFCSTHLDAIMAVCRVHRYQMNEVARCTQLACGLAANVTAGQEPIALVDLGTGAGLALHMDRYRYALGSRIFGPADAAVELVCAVRGRRRPPAVYLPPIAERIGIDVDPVDLEDEEARNWLEACTPPEETALSRLVAAVEVARHHPAEILRGDIVEVLPEVLGSLPPGRSVVVADSYTAVFLAEDRRLGLVEALAEAGRHRPVTWLSLDPLVPLGPSGRHSVQGLSLSNQLVTDYQQQGVFAVLGACRFDSDSSGGRLLARSHPSGTWIEWLEESTLDDLADASEQRGS
jgi:hypothetical protein